MLILLLPFAVIVIFAIPVLLDMAIDWLQGK